MSGFKNSSIKDLLNQIGGFKELNTSEKITAELNLRNLIGDFNLIIDDKLIEYDEFLKNLFFQLLDIKKVEAESISEEIRNKDSLSFINYQSNVKGTNFLDYHNFIQPVNILKIDFDKLSQNTAVHMESPSDVGSKEFDKTLVLLADSSKTQDIYDNHIKPAYSENVYVIVVDKSSLPNPVRTINNQKSSVLIHEFDRTSISSVLEYSDITNVFEEILNFTEKDIKDKLENIKTFNELIINFEKHILGIQNKKEVLKKLADKNEESINKSINQNLDESLSVEQVLESIDSQGIKMKRSEQKEFTEKLLMEKVKTINYRVQHEVEIFNEKTEELIENIEHEFIDVSGLKFSKNVRKWFVSGLASLGTSGALALYLSSFGKFGGSVLLGSFGMFKGGAAVTLLAGPFGLAISAALGAVVLSKSILGWKKSLAKQIRKTATKTIIPNLKENNNQLWDETREAVIVGFDEIIRESRDHFIEQNKDIIDEEKLGRIDGITSA